LIQNLENDIKAYTEFANTHFYMDECPENKRVMSNWNNMELDKCAKNVDEHTV